MNPSFVGRHIVRNELENALGRNADPAPLIGRRADMRGDFDVITTFTHRDRNRIRVVRGDVMTPVSHQYRIHARIHGRALFTRSARTPLWQTMRKDRA
jgi:hypothetical protein